MIVLYLPRMPLFSHSPLVNGQFYGTAFYGFPPRSGRLPCERFFVPVPNSRCFKMIAAAIRHTYCKKGSLSVHSENRSQCPKHPNRARCRTKQTGRNRLPRRSGDAYFSYQLVQTELLHHSLRFISSLQNSEIPKSVRYSILPTRYSNSSMTLIRIR